MDRGTAKWRVNNPKGNRANLTNEGKGRPKGVPNKFTLTLKEAILASFDRVGGIDYLERQARENPQAYMSLLAKVLPMQVSGPNDGPILLITGVVRAGDDGTIDHEPAPMLAPRSLPQPASLPAAALAPVTEATDQDPEPDPPVGMRCVAMARTGARFREVPPAPPTQEGRTVTTETGLRVRTAD